jgi:DNA-binding transcriptional ArsR family regulator
MVNYFHETGNMELTSAAKQLAALGHEKRLALFRRLVEAGPDGLSAGAIAEQQGLAAATLSFHLAHLSRVGLITARQEGRFIYYAANYPYMNALIAYLTDNCCAGHPEHCADTLAAPSCTATPVSSSPPPHTENTP